MRFCGEEWGERIFSIAGKPDRAGDLVWYCGDGGGQYFWLHEAVSSADLLGLVLGLVKILQPENCVTVAQLEKAIGDVSVLMKTGNSAAVGAVVADVDGLVAGVTQTAPKL
jgi:hypothetical protein